jgi:hypothetical protein
MAKRKVATVSVLIERVLTSIRAAKGKAKNQAWNLLHRMESMAATALGTKTKRRKKAKEKTTKKK